jgi:acyl carrier protein
MIQLYQRVAKLSETKRTLLAQRLAEMNLFGPADESGNVKRLCGFIIPRHGQSLTQAELRNFLREKLPAHMVPSAFVMLDELPLTPNGKIDRRALSLSETNGDGSSENAARPLTPIEEILADIWADVLQRDQVTLHDNFFELGGHSLLATRVISRICETLKIEIPIQSLFDSPTIAELARFVEQNTNAGQVLPMIPLERVSRDGELPLSYAQHGLWVRSQIEPDSPLYNLSSSLRLKGQLDLPALRQTLNEIVRRHETLRTVFPTVGGQPRQHILPAAELSLPIKDLRHLAPVARELEAMRLATEEARRPFNLSEGPLLRVTLLQLDDDDYALLCTMHHIISDGWSMSLLIQEVMAYYQMFIAGNFSPRPELSIQYADYAHWQRRWLSGEVLGKQMFYWKQQLEGVNRKLDLPIARLRPAVQTFNGATKNWTLSATLTEDLKALGRRHGATLFMTLLAAFQTLLYRYSGQEDIVVGSPIANRNRPGVEGLIGYFINILALRTDFSGNPTFRELLSRVRATTLSAYAHQDLPFERLLDELRLKRDPSRSPLFQVVLVLQNAPASELKLPNLTVSPLASDRGTTHQDLYFSIAETPEGLSGLLRYNTDLFEAKAITELLEHFDVLLSEITADPDWRLLDIPLAREEKPGYLPTAEPPRVYSEDQFIF